VARVMSGERLGRPTMEVDADQIKINDNVWRLLEACSSPKAPERPSAAEIVRLMELPPDLQVFPDDVDERTLQSPVGDYYSLVRRS
jgi:hypothetical protein